VKLTFMVPQKPLGKQRHQTVTMLRCSCYQRYTAFRKVDCNCKHQFWGERSDCPQCGHQGPFLHVTSREFSPKDQREYERFVGSCAKQALLGVSPATISSGDRGKGGSGSAEGSGSSHFSGPIEISVKFYFAIPETRKKKLAEDDYHCQKPDLDNCIKSVMDALNQLAWSDDSTVVRISASKHWTSGCPRAEVTISSLPQEDTSEIHIDSIADGGNLVPSSTELDDSHRG